MAAGDFLRLSRCKSTKRKNKKNVWIHRSTGRDAMREQQTKVQSRCSAFKHRFETGNSVYYAQVAVSATTHRERAEMNQANSWAVEKPEFEAIDIETYRHTSYIVIQYNTHAHKARSSSQLKRKWALYGWSAACSAVALLTAHRTQRTFGSSYSLSSNKSRANHS